MDHACSFGEWLKRCRNIFGLSQEAFATKLQYAVVTYRKVEYGLPPSRAFAERLAEFLGIEPTARAAFLNFARSGEHPAPFTFLPNLAAPPLQQPFQQQPLTRIPAQPNRLIGRDEDIAAITKLACDPAIRLITLVGPPGVGKTRLSIQAAQHLCSMFTDGVVYVSLSTAHDPEEALLMIIQTLGISDRGTCSLLTTLTRFLQDRHCLLVLDTFEHMLLCAAHLATLLEACPQLKLLITSRTQLRIRAERQLPVLPLMLPCHDDREDIASIARCPAVELFVDRVQAINPSFCLTSLNARAVAAICIRLDGLPLAIELVAKWSKLLTPQLLLERMNNRLLLLKDGPRDGIGHHQTLRAAIDWSFRLLLHREQLLFMRLAIFRGRWSLNAVEAICATDRAMHPLDSFQQAQENGRCSSIADGEHDLSTFDCLNALIEKSLVIQHHHLDGDVHFSMLETLREYAAEQIARSGEAQTLRRRHIAYYLALAEAAEPHLISADQKLWFDRLEYEHDNLREALGSALATAAVETALRLCAALRPFWQIQSHIREGYHWLQETLRTAQQSSAWAASRPELQAHYAKACHSAGILAYLQGNYIDADRWLSKSLHYWRRLDNGEGVAQALHRSGVVAHYRGDNQQAHRCWEASLDLYREQQNQQGIAEVLIEIGFSLILDRMFERAEASFTESLGLARAVGHQVSIADALFGLGFLAYCQQRYALGWAYIEESLQASASLHNRSRGHCLIVLAAMIWQVGGLEAAVRLWGAAEALEQMLGIQLPPAYHSLYQQTLGQARASLPPTLFAQEWAVGRKMSLDQAIQFARSVVAYAQHNNAETLFQEAISNR